MQPVNQKESISQFFHLFRSKPIPAKPKSTSAPAATVPNLNSLSKWFPYLRERRLIKSTQLMTVTQDLETRVKDQATKIQELTQKLKTATADNQALKQELQTVRASLKTTQEDLKNTQEQLKSTEATLKLTQADLKILNDRVSSVMASMIKIMDLLGGTI